jgi:muramoyltetrapeptide carboxypeptidase
LAADGYFAATISDNIRILHDLYQDPSIKGLFAVRGGYGAARLLPHLDYSIIAKNPKILIGYSDLTALLLTIYDQCRQVTFHGPSVGLPIPEFSQQGLNAVLFEAEKMSLVNSSQAANPICITPGTISGQLMGGNLTVLGSLMGTPYFPKNWKGAIFFCEDVNEDVYKMDRLLQQMKLAGILDQIAGFVFGTCVGCTNKVFNSFTLEEVITRHIGPLGIPAFQGAMIGHQEEIHTLPIGIPVRLDSEACRMEILEPAVKV